MAARWRNIRGPSLPTHSCEIGRRARRGHRAQPRDPNQNQTAATAGLNLRLLPSPGPESVFFFQTCKGRQVADVCRCADRIGMDRMIDGFLHSDGVLPCAAFDPRCAASCRKLRRQEFDLFHLAPTCPNLPQPPLQHSAGCTSRFK